jgi:acetyl esterase
MDTSAAQSSEPQLGAGRRRATKIARIGITAIACLAVALCIGWKVSPWPSALLVRYLFDKQAVRVNAELAKHLPEGVGELRNERYDPSDDDALLDVYYPKALLGQPEEKDAALPILVWVHGGGWLSGTKDHITNYAKILAKKRYVVVAIDYSLAPGARYPTPLRQLAAALRYVQAQAPRWRADPSTIFLAGDSAAAQLVAQMANIISVQDYAKLVGVAEPIARSQLAGVLLYCGPYDIVHVNLEGAFGGFIRTLLWSYSGTKEFLTDPTFKTMSVMSYVSPAFPPTFISGGNGDALTHQSLAFAETLRRASVPVDSLFFEDDYSPPQPHEYQFNLDGEAGRLALERSLAFLSAYSRKSRSQGDVQ